MDKFTFVGYEQPFAVGYFGWFEDENRTCKGFAKLDGSIWSWDGDTSELALVA